MPSSAAPLAARLRVPLTCLFGLLALSPLTAMAASFSGPVTVALVAPGGLTTDGSTLSFGPIDLSQTMGASGSITPGDGGDVGGFLLPAESITLSDTSILIRVAQGASDGSTGYLGAGGQHARYTFTGLDVAGMLITGLSYSVTDDFGAGSFSGLANLPVLTAANAIRLTSPSSLVLELDQIQFKDRGQGESNNFADFRIDLQITPIPEPQALVMALMGLGAVALVRARKGHTHV